MFGFYQFPICITKNKANENMKERRQLISAFVINMLQILKLFPDTNSMIRKDNDTNM